MVFEIDAMLQIKNILTNMKDQTPCPRIEQILTLVDEYIHHQCEHSIVTDTIDVDVEQTMTIRYCENCMKTFE
jgi:hypothetical protein|tara:strand:+ start:102 stop:320 length:219 start_codon:yes stop_codon:yes gene_type:complete